MSRKLNLGNDQQHARSPRVFERKRYNRAAALLLASYCLLLSSALAQSWGQGPPPRRVPIPASDKPRDLQEVGIDQKLDEQLPLDATFRDESGQEVKLGAYFGRKPVVLAL